VDRLRSEGRLQRRADGAEVLWLCPSDPRNFALERDSMLEVVRQYDVAGIHFDYIRYPDDRTCCCEGCRERFCRDAGAHVASWPDDVLTGPLAASYLQWRQDQITRLVRAVAEEARRIRPGVMISAAVFEWPGAIDWVNQDWPRWVDEGLLDFVCPMNYTASRDDLERMVVQEVRLVAGRIPLYIGIGEFIIGETHDLVEQLELARRLGADGFVCFCYEHLGRTQGRLQQLRSALTAGSTAPPHPAPRVQFDFDAGAPGRLGLAYRQEDEVSVGVALLAESNYGESIGDAIGSIWLETSAGDRLRRIGTIRLGEPVSLALSLAVPPGICRLSLRGTAELGSSPSRDFIVRSRPFEVLSRAAAASHH
jgi:hypothetical protein